MNRLRCEARPRVQGELLGRCQTGWENRQQFPGEGRQALMGLKARMGVYTPRSLGLQVTEPAALRGRLPDT